MTDQTKTVPELLRDALKTVGYGEHESCALAVEIERTVLPVVRHRTPPSGHDSSGNPYWSRGSAPALYVEDGRALIYDNPNEPLTLDPDEAAVLGQHLMDAAPVARQQAASIAASEQKEQNS